MRVLGTRAERRGGSSPSIRTKQPVPPGHQTTPNLAEEQEVPL
jgi:hypothetical protein